MLISLRDLSYNFPQSYLVLMKGQKKRRTDNLNVLDASMKLYLSLQESLHVNMIYKKAILSS